MREIVHICSSYSRQRLWRELALSLESSMPTIRQKWFVPVRTDWEIGHYSIDSSRTKVYYNHCLRPYHKVLFFLKIWQTFHWIKLELSGKEPRVVHAHFLFTDGGVALLLYLFRKVRFVVSVRNTDIHGYFKYAVHLRWFAKIVLKKAEKIVLISPSYQEKLIGAVGIRFYKKIKHKVVVIPNKLTDRWFEVEKHNPELQDIKLLYVGDNTPNKRFDILIDLLERLPENYSATFVGIEPRDLSIPAHLASRVSVEGKVVDFRRLLEYYRRSHILILPSARETFGMVAAEALAQGRPILISRGEGISGFIEGDLPLSCVDFLDVQGVIANLKAIMAEYDEQSALAERSSHQFSEKKVMDHYHSLYSVALTAPAA